MPKFYIMEPAHITWYKYEVEAASDSEAWRKFWEGEHGEPIGYTDGDIDFYADAIEPFMEADGWTEYQL